MSVRVGFFDGAGNPCVKFHLAGVFSDAPGLEFTGILDTGFTGFVQLPIQHAFILGLPLYGATSATLADGSTIDCLTALGALTFAGQTKVGVTVLANDSDEALVGMDFLRKFKLTLVLGSAGVVLMGEEWLGKAMKAGGSKGGPPTPPETA